MAAHLFILRGDLKHLACSAILVPCDDEWQVVTKHWRGFLPMDRFVPSDVNSDWSRLRGQQAGRFAEMPSLPDGRRVRLVVTADGRGDARWVADGVVQAIDGLAQELDTPSGRLRPLVALPLVGAGDGGFRHRRGGLIRALLPMLQDLAARTNVDVALVLRYERDHAAVQSLRGDSDWPELSKELTAEADSLGGRASRGELSLFVGSGVSVPLGLPTWPQLLDRLAAKAGLTLPAYEPDQALATAQRLKDQMGQEQFRQLLVDLFTVDKCAPAHLLLAALGVRQVVTTNYDCALERALDVSVGTGRYRVLTAEMGVSSDPWLLKLHGTVDRPDTMVLTSDEYEYLKTTLSSLRAIVECLLLTSHMVFVGFGMGDRDFVEAVAAVQQVRDQAISGGGDDATVISLYPDAVTPQVGFAVHAMSDSTNDKDAARLLEIFLDRVAWAAAHGQKGSAAFLLDDDYADLFPGKAETELRQQLHGLRTLSPDSPARQSKGWTRVQEMLEMLGAATPDQEIDPQRRSRRGPSEHR